MTEPKKRYGWKPDIPDHRDMLFSAAPRMRAPVALPPSADLMKWMPDVYNQGETNSCTGNACASATECLRIKDGRPMLTNPSRLHIYYGARVLGGYEAVDCGATIRDTMKALSSWGYCDEELWPFDPKRIVVRPPKTVYDAASKYKLVEYCRLNQNIMEIKAALAQGHPVILGISIYESFEGELVAKTGIVNMPGPKEAMRGGHAVVLIGYDDRKQRWLLRNSWGDKWGIKGNFTLPYQYILNPDLAADLWVLRVVP